jgi:hypothetical protein
MRIRPSRPPFLINIQEESMTRRLVIVAALTLVFGVPAAWAHEGHSHKVLGTVAMLHENHLQVQTKDGKTVTITVNEKTSILKGKQKAVLTDLQPGARVVVDVGDGKEPLVARSVTLGAAAAKTPAKATTAKK